MELFEMRRHNYELDEIGQALLVSYGSFFRDQCPTSRVRAAEPFGFDQELWDRLVELGTTRMSLPDSAGGDGGGILELALVAEEFGRAAAPVPYIEHVVASRALAAVQSAVAQALEDAAAGTRIVSLASEPVQKGVPQLVPAGAVATRVLALSGDELVLFSVETSPPHVSNQGSTPLAWWDFDSITDRVVLASGAEAKAVFERAQAEYMVLMASALVGLTESALALTIEFAKTRETMGVSIATLQGVAFPLADVVANIAGARNLARKAAWYLDNAPQERPELPAIALTFSARTATTGTQVAAHFQGGLGFTYEADVSLYFLRSKGWSALAGDPSRHLINIGQLVLAAV